MSPPARTQTAHRQVSKMRSEHNEHNESCACYMHAYTEARLVASTATPQGTVACPAGSTCRCSSTYAAQVDPALAPYAPDLPAQALPPGDLTAGSQQASLTQSQHDGHRLCSAVSHRGAHHQQARRTSQASSIGSIAPTFLRPQVRLQTDAKQPTLAEEQGSSPGVRGGSVCGVS